MKFFKTVRTATRALSRNVMRAFLTTLGIIIGIAAVIAMMEIGKGSSTAIQNSIASMGANSILIFPGTARAAGVSSGNGTSVNLTPADCAAIITQCPDVKAAAPIVRVRTQVVYENKNDAPGIIYGTTPEFLQVRDWTNLAEGIPFTDEDVLKANKVCLIGQTTAKNLFDKESPIGKVIRVQNVGLKIIGLLSAKGANMGGQDQDSILLAPWTTIKFRVSGTSATIGNSSAAGSASSSGISTAVNSLSSLYPTSSVSLYTTPSTSQQADTPLPVRFINVDQIVASAYTAGDIDAAVEQVTGLLRQRHHLPDASPEDFQVLNMTEMMNTLTSASTRMTSLLLAVACISLVVGGVGIMNIMLVSVTERTREIGLRMAVGARGRDILWQFLVEATLLCLAGGAIGIGLGVGTSALVTWLMAWPTESSPAAIGAAVAVSGIVGIIFGFYPAWKASRLDPIDALRYE